MSDKFLTRWSRRKQRAAEPNENPPAERVEAENISSRPAKPADNEKIAANKPSAPAEPLLDLKNLPPLESIVASTDIRPFLAPGVPPELTRAALRRAWVSDPAIRDFIGISENSWDFTKPDSMPGFGPLQMTDELRKIVTEMFERIPSQQDETKSVMEEKPAGSPEVTARRSELASPEKINPHAGEEVSGRGETVTRNVALQPAVADEKANDPSPRRGHGGALPK